MVDSEAAPPGKLGAQATLVGRLRVYKADGGATTGGGACSDGDGWQRGIVASLCPRGTFSHVVAYTRQASALRGTVDSDILLDARAAQAPTAPTGCFSRRPRRRAWRGSSAPAPPSLAWSASLSLAGGSSPQQLPARTGRSNDMIRILVECCADACLCGLFRGQRA